MRLGAAIFAGGFIKKCSLPTIWRPLSTRCTRFRMAWISRRRGSAHGVCVQIYFDFSGYSEMAIGLAQMMACRSASQLCLSRTSPEPGRILAALAHHAVAVAA
jgi:D-alanyl-lipoteichoic acid acyltransferase DltB (MBOAT superfamily)